MSSRLERLPAVIERAQFSGPANWLTVAPEAFDEAMDVLKRNANYTLSEIDFANRRQLIRIQLARHIGTVDRTPHVPTHKAHAKNIAKIAQALLDAMYEAECDCRGVDFWRELDKFDVVYQVDPRRHTPFEESINYVSEIADAAKAASERWNSQKPESMHVLIAALANIWKDETGKKPTPNRNKTHGENPTEFQKFVTATMACLPEGQQYREGLESAFRKVTANRGQPFRKNRQKADR